MLVCLNDGIAGIVDVQIYFAGVRIHRGFHGVAYVVCAFNTVPSEVLFDVYEARSKKPRSSLVYCGDDRSAKDLASALIEDVGFDPVDAGPLRIARYTEPFALLIGQLAYEGEGGPELAYRFERFGG